ncbi:MAG: metallophosphoesterase family protein [Firmicutes bacterium]|nr:metallophosphoesterase family protein [Bacillota bacterium]
MFKRSIAIVITTMLIISSLAMVAGAEQAATLGGLEIADLAYKGSGAQPQVAYGYEDGSGGFVGDKNKDGVQLYVTSAVYLMDTYTYPLPDFLKGQTFIKVDGRDSKDKQSVAIDFLQFTVNRAVTVYIGMETRTLNQLAENGKPSPVADYTQIEDEEGNPVVFWGNGGHQFILYQKDFNAGDIIYISGNGASNTECIPYVPIVVPRVTLSAKCFYFADEEEITSISYNEGKQVEARFDFVNTTGSPVDAVLLTCVYSDNMLVDIKTKSVSVSLGDTTQTNHLIEIPHDATSSFIIKSFAWTFLSEMVPITILPDVLPYIEVVVDPDDYDYGSNGVSTIYNTPEQIVVCMGSDPQTSVDIVWTTIDTKLWRPVVRVFESDDSEYEMVFPAVMTSEKVSDSTIKRPDGRPSGAKAFYKTKVTGLTPDTRYTYICQAEDINKNIYESRPHTFITAPDEPQEFSFIYVTDLQSNGSSGKSATATTEFFMKNHPEARFIYNGGDNVNKANDEGHWEALFNQPGNVYYIDRFENGLSDFIMATVAQNHDEDKLETRWSFPSSAGPNAPTTYAFDYGLAHFIMLNTERVGPSAPGRAEQVAFLRSEATKAKNAGKLVVVGFHKAVYSGGVHFVNAVNSRTLLVPLFAELDVDLVLSGHDHMFARGFNDGEGQKADITQKVGHRTYVAESLPNIPLYMVNGAGSNFNFYPSPSIDYEVTEGDLLMPEFGNLDINSGMPVGHELNPDGPQLNVYKGPSYSLVTVTDESINIKTYMYKYDGKTDTISEPLFLYDDITILKEVNITEN